MLKVNVGLSRKLSKDYNSEGFSINIEGEVSAAVNDPQAVVEQVRELQDLAEEALAQQIERAQSTAAIASRDEEPRGHEGNGRRTNPENNRRTSSNGNGHKPDEAATNKQIQYLLSIGKRMRISTAALEKEIADILGREINLYDLSKEGCRCRHRPVDHACGQQSGLSPVASPRTTFMLNMEMVRGPITPTQPCSGALTQRETEPEFHNKTELSSASQQVEKQVEERFDNCPDSNQSMKLR